MSEQTWLGDARYVDEDGSTDGFSDTDGSFSGTLSVSGVVTFSDTLAVTGAVTLSSTLTVGGFLFGTAGDGDPLVSWSGADKIRIDTATGNVALSGGVIVNGGLNSTGDIDMDNTKVLKANGTQVVGAQGAAVADASGVATVDAEARAAINDLLARVRAHGLIAT